MERNENNYVSNVGSGKISSGNAKNVLKGTNF